ncbi:hypothetical protein ACX3O0_03190 [Homoserinimonas sp. A447]
MSLLAFAAAEGHELAPMVMDPIWFAVIAGAAFLLLGVVVWSFRDVSNRHDHRGPVTDKDPTHGAH